MDVVGLQSTHLLLINVFEASSTSSGSRSTETNQVHPVGVLRKAEARGDKRDPGHLPVFSPECRAQWVDRCIYVRFRAICMLDRRSSFAGLLQRKVQAGSMTLLRAKE